MKVLFIDTVHPLLWESLTAEGFDCAEGYTLSREEIIKLIPDFDGIVIRSRIIIDRKFWMPPGNCVSLPVQEQEWKI